MLLSTVGPFKRWGEPALERRDRRRRDLRRLDRRAARSSGACSTSPRRARAARRRDAAAGARLRLRPGRARGRARARGRRRRAPSASTSATTRSAAAPRRSAAAPRPRWRASRSTRAFAFRGGRIVTVRSAERVRSFAVRGKDRPAISVGGAEHFGLPAAYPRLREVNVYLGWFGPASRVDAGVLGGRRGAHADPRRPRAARARAATSSGRWAVPGRSRGRRRAPTATSPARPTTPTAGCWRRSRSAAPTPTTSPRASSPGRRGAPRTAGSSVRGAAGPLAAFGLDGLREGCAASGIEPL